MFRALNAPVRFDPPRLAGNQNRTPRVPTQLSDEDQRQFAEIIERLPYEHLAIFGREPYARLSWSRVLQPSSGTASGGRKPPD
jgi:hypothetical protein